ncbi:MAG: mechanosensitive ion channel [Betaproteobacteria bacterium]|nr:mechanosensitive ion channel [Betaproteobacteria bacterium]
MIALSPLLEALWTDLQSPAVFWQVAVIAACLLLARWLERVTQERWRRDRAAALAAQAALTGEEAPPGDDAASAAAGANPETGLPEAPGSPGTGPAGATAATAAPAASLPDTTAAPAANLPGATAGGDAPRHPSARLAASAARSAVGRVLFPAYAAALMAAARPLLAVWQHTNLLHIAMVLAAGLALARGIGHMVARMAGSSTAAFFLRLLAGLVWVTVALYVTGYADDVVALADSMQIPVGKQRVSVWTIVSASFWVLVTLLGALWLGSLIEARLLAVDAGDVSVRVVLARVMRALLLLLALMIGLSLVGLDLTALSVFSGALGVGIGLGLQRIASSYVSGFVVLLERRVRMGDFVTVDKYYGRVSEIRTRFTVIRSLEGWESIIPNEMLMANPVQNFSKQASARLRSSVTVGYRTDLEQLFPRLEALARAHPRVVADPPPQAMLAGFGADGLNIDLAYSVSNGEIGRPVVQSEINLAILGALRADGVEIPYPQREIRFLNGPGAGYTARDD